MTYFATRKTVAYGGSVYVVLDKSWGIKAGEMVTIQVDKVDTGSTTEGGHKETSGHRRGLLVHGERGAAFQARRP